MNTIKNQIEASKRYCGNGTYKHLAPILTQKALDLGYSAHFDGVIRLNGSILGEYLNLDKMAEDKLISLQWIYTNAV